MSNAQRMSIPLPTRSESEAAAVPVDGSGNPMGITIREATGVTRNTLANNRSVVEQHSINSWNPREHTSKLPGVLSSGRGLAGQPLSDVSQVKDSSRFVIAGVEMDAEGAARLGYLTRVGKDQFSLPEHGEVNEPAAAPVDTTPAIPEFSRDAVSAVAELATYLGSEQRVNALVAPALAHLAEGEGGFERAVKSIASTAGVEPSRAAEIVAGMAEDLRGQTIAHLNAHYGVDGAKAVEFLDTLKQAERVNYGHRVFLGDPSVYKEIAERYSFETTIKAVQSQPGWKR